MKLNELILADFQYEMNITLRILKATPSSIFDFQPHEKSKTVAQLVNHMMAIPSWVSEITEADQLDWANYSGLDEVKSTKDLVENYENFIARAVTSLNKVSSDSLLENWTMRNGDSVYFNIPRYMALRNLIINHTIHHRAQLGVMLRLNDVSVPATYVASADERL